MLLVWDNLTGHRLAEMVVWPRWSSGRDGRLAEMVVWPRWSSGRDGRLAEMVVWPRWSSGRDGRLAEMVVWLCRHGIMPLYTPLGGSWLNMAESVQRILKRRTLDGQHPQSPKEI